MPPPFCFSGNCRENTVRTHARVARDSVVGQFLTF